ncbi:MAG TPA: 1-deoxy-D-xylulose-5-phosphate reductoisomerase [Xanthomonadales bacterium]|nr:1-deoxy-D-xylulose-5-phosphate reductoisomerase [Xanthomonadales bacterium]
MKRIALLGATGSIGGSALDVVARHPGRFRAVALTANRDVAKLVACCAAARPDVAVIADEAQHDALARGLREAGLATRALAGSAALDAVASSPEVDTVLAAIVGAAGLPSTLAAARAGKRILLANKEAVVVAGELLATALREGGGTVLPVDSEHNALFQCLPAGYARDPARHGVERIVLTASGGPFRGRSAESLANVTPDEACAHPNWRMGRKISVDSATLMNKGLEVIEAQWLFGIAPERIEVVVHPQSIVHALVGYVDGSTLAQLGNPDMRTAIAHALAWPERVAAGVSPLDLVKLGRLDFLTPDLAAFPCLGLAYRALRAGGTAPATLNAANEVAVEAFLNGLLDFPGIARTVAATLDELAPQPVAALPALLEADARARAAAGRHVAGLRAPA